MSDSNADPGSPGNTQHDTCKNKNNKTVPRQIIFKLQSKKKIKKRETENLEKNQRSKDKNYIQILTNHEKKKRMTEIFRVFREIKYQPRNPYSVKLSFMSEGEIKTFSDKKNLGIYCQ